jgi:prophage antirepressor-like protein
MKDELKVLKLAGTMNLVSKKLEIDFYGDYENPYFLASDIANWLSVQNVSQMLKQAELTEDQKGIFLKYTLGGEQKSLFINEDGMYDTLISSRKAIAKTLRKDIKAYLKQIRLTGGVVQEGREEEFVNNNFSSFSDTTKKSMVNDLIKSNEEYKKRISELEPDAELARNLMQRKGLLTLKQVADNIEIGRTTLCSLLREKKILSKQTGYNEPMGKYIKSPYFKTVVEENEKTKHISIVTLVTPKGLKFIYRLIKKNQLLDEFDTTLLQEVSVNA